MKAVAALLIALVLVTGAPTQALLAQSTGSIIGHVVNGTAGASPPADLDVVVHVIQNRVKVGEQRVRTDRTGAFSVGGLVTGPDTRYFPIVQYAGVAYFPERPVVLSGPEPASADITVFEATPQPDAVSFERLNMLVMGVSPTSLTVMEMGTAVNASDRTYAADAQVTGSGRTLRFVLPPGAIDVTPQAGLPADSLEATPDGFAATDPVRPGRREIAFSYQLPYTSSSLDLTRSFTLPVNAFTLYAPPDLGEIVAPGMALQGTVDLGGRPFRQYVSQRVAPGAEVRFRLTGLPAPLFGTPRELGLAVAGVTAALLVMALALGVWRRTSPVPADRAGSGDSPADRSEHRQTARDAQIRAVAELDERYAAGQIDEQAYRAERAERKSRLLAIPQTTAGAT